MKLLTSNHKLAKCSEYGYEAVGLHLLPARTFRANGQKFNTCQWSTPGCRAACLNRSGMGVFGTAQDARRRRLNFFTGLRPYFKGHLEKEVELLEKRAKKNGLKPAVRLNVISDIPWEAVFPQLFERFPSVQFYDYTKGAERMLSWCRKPQDWPDNYHLTFSWSGENFQTCLDVLNEECNVAIPVTEEIKRAALDEDIWTGLKWSLFDRQADHYVDGDLHDLTFLHPQGSLLLLSPKGRARKDKTGFVVR